MTDEKPTALIPKFENIPPRMRAADRWCVWKYEKRKNKAGEEKWSKPPYQPNGRYASSTDRETWSSFAAVVAAYKSDGWDGIGFFLGDNWIGVDFDHMTDVEAMPHLHRLNAYAEISASGTGCHSLALAQLNSLDGKKTDGFEFYAQSRFFTVTGHAINGFSQLPDDFRTGEFAAFYREMFKIKPPPPPPPCEDEIDQQCERVMRAEPKLWSGDLSEHGNDHSAGDMALVGCIYRLCGREHIDAIFRRSCLMRDKWDSKRGSKTYGQQTIERAIASTRNHHQDKTQQSTPPPPSTDDEPVLVRMADVPNVEIDWVWEGRIPNGRISLLNGVPGEGKSFFTTDLAARISTGSPFPDGQECEHGSVLLICAEDDPGDTIAPRLRAAGADMNRIHLLTMVKRLDKNGKKNETVFTLQDIEVLKKAMNSINDLRLVVIDPIGSYLGGRTDSHRDNEVRAVLAPVAQLASLHNVAMLVVCHSRKSFSSHADDNVMGSRAFTGLARTVWHLIRDKDDKHRRLLLPGKNNLAAEGDGLAFTIGGDPAHILWEKDPVMMNADECMAAAGSVSGPPPERREAAEEFLVELLKDAPVLSDDVWRACKDNGFSVATIRRAKAAIGIKCQKCAFSGKWEWRLLRPGR